MQLQLEGISKQVGAETHIHPLDLTLQPGKINVLLGQTRAGKTTLMRLMAGLDRPTQGKVIADGRDVTGVSVRQRKLAMVYQQFVNYPAFSVFENIASPLRLAGGLSETDIKQRVQAMAEKLHIAHLLDRLPGALSGGQQQRTAMARAMVKQAPLLLLDEPLVNLDYKLREELRAELKDLFADSQTTVVYATTEPQEALLLGGYTAVLDEGRLLQFAPTLDVFHHPATRRVAQVFSDPPMNLFPATVRGDAREVHLDSDLSIPLAPHLTNLPTGQYSLGIRPSHLRLAPRSNSDVALPCEVELAEISGSDTYLHVRHGRSDWVSQLAGVNEFEPGSTLTLYIDPREVFAFDNQGKLAGSPSRTA
ncbi:ABC transporter ATP-binding protein [Parachitinimonas caeni]|uniref:ABC transporter ATP-binding protein n=1 Tax=Parachitinimonas caeni TaxID=3031301 RepID=A0ABT7E346_9NEIS|nr:ABC transporter ATP-binding protein [Parachitinimonas caeni]MDK2126735.1 ABC transporter ATP-binding protein [Parachitinimonas caeni]